MKERFTLVNFSKLIGMFLGLYIAYEVYKVISQYLRPDETVFQEHEVIQAIVVDETMLSITDAQASYYAKYMWDSMRDLGTDNVPEMISILQSVNSEDFKLIYKKFGLRPYLSIMGGTFFGFGTDMGLLAWYDEEGDGLPYAAYTAHPIAYDDLKLIHTS